MKWNEIRESKEPIVYSIFFHHLNKNNKMKKSHHVYHYGVQKEKNKKQNCPFNHINWLENLLSLVCIFTNKYFFYYYLLLLLLLHLFLSFLFPPCFFFFLSIIGPHCTVFSDFYRGCIVFCYLLFLSFLPVDPFPLHISCIISLCSFIHLFIFVYFIINIERAWRTKKKKKYKIKERGKWITVLN